VEPFFLPPQICDIKILAKKSQKYIAKVLEFSLEKPKIPNFLSKKKGKKKLKKVVPKIKLKKLVWNIDFCRGQILLFSE
jgi:hypothetical protein